MNVPKTYYHSIDVFRFICAIFVVTVHVTSQISSHDIATWANYYSYRYLLDIGSPFFFMAAGFIIFHKSTDQGPSYLITYGKKILSYFIVFSLFYMVARVVIEATSAYMLSESVLEAIQMQLSQWNALNVLNGSIGSFQLYFLILLLYSAIFLYGLLRLRVHPLGIFALAVALYGLENIGLFDSIQLFYYKSFAFGFLYVVLGYTLNYTKDKVSYRAPWVYTLLIAGAYVATYYYHLGLSWILLPLFTFSLGTLCVQYPNIGKGTILTKLSSYSLAIYTLHIFVELLVLKAVQLVGWTTYYMSPLYYVGTIIVCIVLPCFLFQPVYHGALWLKEKCLFSYKTKPGEKEEFQRKQTG
ncbi:acyltransferase family protein [Alkalihalobacillus sp. NPDC078783]